MGILPTTRSYNGAINDGKSLIAVAKVHTRDGKHDRSDMLNGVNHPWSQASCSTMSRQRSTMHSPGATGQEGHDSQTLTTGVHPPCLRASADKPTLGYRIREIEDFTAEFRQRMRCNPTSTMGEYIYGVILLSGLIIYDQQEQLRRRANHYSARFTPNHMVWHACRVFLELVTPE